MREYIKAARDEAAKSRCDRAHVGCVIVDRATGQVVSRAFNETPHGLEPCDTGGHRIVDNHCVNTVHAERNAIMKMTDHGERVHTVRDSLSLPGVCPPHCVVP